MFLGFVIFVSVTLGITFTILEIMKVVIMHKGGNISIWKRK